MTTGYIRAMVTNWGKNDDDDFFLAATLLPHVRYYQARRDISEREEMLQRERQSAVEKVQQESSLEKEKLDNEVARLREDKLKLGGLNREMNDRASLVRRPIWQWMTIFISI